MNRDEQPESAPPAASPEATAPLPPAEPPPAELELPATPEHVVQAVIAATRRAGGAVEGIEPTEAAEVDEHAQPAAGGAPALEGGRGYCVATYALDPQDDEPVMTVYDLVDAGGGVTRVRIVQCGFGDQAAWDAVMERWHRRAHRRRTGTTLDFSIHRIHPYRPGGPPFPEQPPVVSPGWRAPWGGPAPGLALPRVGRGLQGTRSEPLVTL
ncbi:MAG TPA: hypothetical protein VHS99_25685, partial [Chloroflexota bacterium]|nr:hypothetical protein [Chloroflexota bacterium]